MVGHVNNLSTFATGGGANVLSSSAWAADPTRTLGFVAGLAKSIQVNTAARQAAFAAAMIGQFTADFGNADVVDDGNVAAFEADFEAALLAFINPAVTPPAALVHYGIDTGVANHLVATVTPAITSLLNGMLFEITPLHANTLAAVDFNPSGQGAVNCFRSDGTALVAQDIQGPPGKSLFCYDQPTNKMLLVNAALWASAQQTNAVFFGQDTGSANHMQVAIAAITSLQIGTLLVINKSSFVNNAAVDLQLNGGSLIPVQYADGTALAANDWPASKTFTLEYDGTNLNLPVPVASVARRGIGRTATLTEAVNGVTAASVPAWMTPEDVAAAIAAALAGIGNPFLTTGVGSLLLVQWLSGSNPNTYLNLSGSFGAPAAQEMSFISAGNAQIILTIDSRWTGGSVPPGTWKFIWVSTVNTPNNIYLMVRIA
jgi:hypothetical protein